MPKIKGKGPILRKSRIPGYEESSYSGAELIKQIKDERTKELFGEGFRFTGWYNNASF